jgi:hypothetical protein
MTRAQQIKLNRIFNEIVKNNMAWRESTEVAPIFGGHRVGPEILEAIHDAWVDYCEGQDLEPFDWVTPIIQFRRFPGGWLALAIAIEGDTRWHPCAAPPRRGVVKVYTKDRLRKKMGAQAGSSPLRAKPTKRRKAA